MSRKKIAEDVRQHEYGTPVDHVRVASQRTKDHLVTVGWRMQGLCARDTTDSWFAHGGSNDLRRAKIACSMCPVRMTCLGSALLHGEEFGVWGGFDPGERVGLDRSLREGAMLEDVLASVFGERHAAG